jgi:hypothetical protein
MDEKENLMEGDDFPFIERTATPQITLAEGTIQDFGTENEFRDFAIHFGGSHLEPPFPHNVSNDSFISFSMRDSISYFSVLLFLYFSFSARLLDGGIAPTVGKPYAGISVGYAT